MRTPVTKAMHLSKYARSEAATYLKRGQKPVLCYEWIAFGIDPYFVRSCRYAMEDGEQIVMDEAELKEAITGRTV